MRHTLPIGLVLLIPALASGLMAQGTQVDRKLEAALKKAYDSYKINDYRVTIETLRRADPLCADLRVRKMLASSHNQRGSSMYKAGKYREALGDFRVANQLRPGQEPILQSLGVVSYRLGRKTDARQFMERLVRLFPKNATGLAILGELAKERNQVGKASDYYSRAAAADPKREDYRKKASAMGKQSRVESKFVTRERGNFKVHFERGKVVGVEAAVKTVLGYLQQTHRELATLIGGRPNRKVIVMVYNSEQYGRVNSSHTWARAYYDGKLRIAIRGWPAGRAELRQDLRHELTHAFLHEVYPNTPLWAHEGLAQTIEGKRGSAATQKFRTGALELLPMKTFLGAFASSKSKSVVDRGYAQSLMFVDYLMKIGKRRKFQRLLGEFRRGTKSAQAVRLVYGKTIEKLLAAAMK